MAPSNAEHPLGKQITELMLNKTRTAEIIKTGGNLLVDTKLVVHLPQHQTYPAEEMREHQIIR